MTRLPGLVARTRAVDDPMDLLSIAASHGLLFSRRGIGFAARGEAWRGPRSQAVQVMAAMTIDDPLERPGSGPVAFAALPFLADPDAPMVIPELIAAVAEDGTRWVTSIVPTAHGDDDPIARLRAAVAQTVPSPPSPSSFEVTSTRSPEHWLDAVARATDQIRAGHLDKVVLAREIVVTADRPIDASEVLARLDRAFPDCYLFHVDGLCGASPELLVSRSGEEVRAQPMAGTAPRAADPLEDDAIAARLMASTTYRHEHQVTIDAVHDTLLEFCSYVDYQPEPSVVRLANVVHLASSVVGRLSLPAASVLELVDALHPTPAVCGRPRAAALDLIASLEGLERGRYAGAVGWVDVRGNGEWAVSIRCAELEGPVARALGGCGIVAESDPATELSETRSKLQAILGAIVRP